MTEITRAPLVQCDCCGATAEKVRQNGQWVPPLTWDWIRVMGSDGMDTCLECAVLLRRAVNEAIKTRQETLGFKPHPQPEAPLRAAINEFVSKLAALETKPRRPSSRGDV